MERRRLLYKVGAFLSIIAFSTYFIPAVAEASLFSSAANYTSSMSASVVGAISSFFGSLFGSEPVVVAKTDVTVHTTTPTTKEPMRVSVATTTPKIPVQKNISVQTTSPVVKNIANQYVTLDQLNAKLETLSRSIVAYVNSRPIGGSITVPPAFYTSPLIVNQTSSNNTGGNGASTWGSISGSISDQLDLIAVLNGKLSLSDFYATTTSVTRGGTGVTTAPSYGQVLVGNGTGGYNLVATSSLGISGGTGGSSQWTTTGSDIYYTTGNVGVGTTSPFAKLSVQNGSNFDTGLLIKNYGFATPLSVVNEFGGDLLSLNYAGDLSVGRNISTGNGYGDFGSTLRGIIGDGNRAAGYFTDGSNVVSIADGTNPLAITGSATVGISYTNSSGHALIKVDGDAASQAGYYIHKNGTEKAQIAVLGGSDDLTFSMQGTPYMTLTSGGELQVGTTATGLGKFVVAGDAGLNAGYFGGNALTGSSYGVHIAAGTNASDYALNVTDQTRGTDFFRIAGNGNVGIGISTPSSQLHIFNGSGNAELRMTANGAYDPIFRMTGENNMTSEGLVIQYDNDIGDTYFNNVYTGSNAAFHFQSGGTDKLTILTNGNVGIGNTNPGAPLAFANGVGDKIYFYNSSDQYGLGIQSNELRNFTGSSAGVITFGKQSGGTFSELMRINNAGNVGIGTTSPYATLSVAGDIVGTGNLTLGTFGSAPQIRLAGSSGYGTITESGNNLTIKTVGNDTLTLDSGSAGHLTLIGQIVDLSAAHVITTTGNDMNFQVNIGGIGTTVATIQTGTGNFGIGTTSPYAKLSVEGDIVAGNRIIATSTTAQVIAAEAAIGYTSNGTGYAGFGYKDLLATNGGYALLQDSGGHTYLNAYNSHNIYFRIQNQDKAILDSNGNFGIGSSTPNAKLAVAGSIASLPTPNVTNTTLLGSQSAGSAPWGIALKGNIAYVSNVSNDNIYIYDVSTSTPSLVGSVSVTGNQPKGMAIQGNYLYVSISISGTLQIFDISKPKSPVSLGTMALTSGATELVISGKFLYAGTGASVDILDISNPVSPRKISNMALSSASTKFYVEGKYLYAPGQNNSFDIYDISNPQAGVRVSSTSTINGPFAAYVSGSYAYLGAAYSSDIKVYDVSNPASIVQVGSITLSGGITDIRGSGRYLYVGDGNNFTVVDVVNPTAPVKVSSSSLSTGNIQSLRIIGRYAYMTVTGTNTFKKYDIGGVEANSVLAHSLDAGSLNVWNDITANGKLFVNSSVNVGSGGIFSNGPLSVGLASTTETNAVSALFQGMVGVGTTSPYKTLSVNGSIAGTDLYLGGQYFAMATGTANYLIGSTQSATLTGTDNFFVGNSSGSGASAASFSNFIGNSAGTTAISASYSNFFGLNAGALAANASSSNFFGRSAGSSATNAAFSNFSGYFAGYQASASGYSNMFGYSAGYQATNAAYSNFLGFGAGYTATNASSSIFIGERAGFQATNANNAIFLGKYAGNTDTVNNSNGSASILIGNYTSTGGFSNSIAIGRGTQNSASQQLNLGNVLFATGIYNSDVTSNTALTSGRVGIGTSSPTYPLDVYAVGTDAARFVGSSGGAQCIVVAGTGWSCSSDSRLKQNVQELSGSLDKVLALNGVSFNWKQGDTTTTQLGFIAQDVESVIPELVRTDAAGYKSVLYAQVAPYLVEAVKEMNTKITFGTSTIQAELAKTDESLFTEYLNMMTAPYHFVQARVVAVSGYFKNIFAQRVTTKELCLDDVCVTKDQLKTLLNGAGAQPASVQASQQTTTTTTSNTSTTTPSTASSTPSTASSTLAVTEQPAPTTTEQPATTTAPVVENTQTQPSETSQEQAPTPQESAQAPVSDTSTSTATQ